MDPNSDFQKRIVEYLESVHVGEFMTGTTDEVKEQVDENMKAKEYRDPTQTLPDAPPELAECDSDKCEFCENTANWWQNLKNTVNDLKTGALNIKKGERWINTLTPIVTF